MGKELICSVTHDGETSWWYGERAGSFLNSSELYRTLLWSKEMAYKMDHAMAMVSYSMHDPERIQLDQGTRKPAFQAISYENAAWRMKDDTVMVFHINLDHERVDYVRPQLLAGQQVTTMRQIDVLNCRWDPDIMEDYEESIFLALQMRAEHWYRIRGRNAVYEVSEYGDTSFYYADMGGGHCNPVLALNTMRRAGSMLHELGMRSSVRYIINGLMESAFIGADSDREKEALREIEDKRAQRLANRLREGYDDISVYIRLNFDTQRITFLHSPESGRPIFDLTFDQAMDLLEEARIGAANSPDSLEQFDERIEKLLIQLLSDYGRETDPGSEKEEVCF